MTPIQKLAVARARRYANGQGKIGREDLTAILSVLDSVTLRTPKKKLGDPRSVSEYMYFLRGLRHEEMWVLMLDVKNQLIDQVQVSKGGCARTSVTASDILRPAIASGASAVVLVHNHPSGDPEPSVEDIEMTRTMLRLCKELGVPLLDHVVVASGGYRSIVDLIKE